MRHLDVIRRFGRFPRRTADLGRAHTAGEAAYLAEPGAGFRPAAKGLEFPAGTVCIGRLDHPEGAVATSIRLSEFARLCSAVYHENVTEVAGFVRSGFHRNGSGFQGAYFTRPNGMATDFVVTVAGTQVTDGADLAADAGFGGAYTGAASGLLSALPGLGTLLAAPLQSGAPLLEAQVRTATEMVRLARQAARKAGSRVFITGHSLGGGIAQIVASFTGTPAVAISAPAVTAVPGVEAAWRRNQPEVYCLRVRNDPINNTSRIASWIGRVRTLPSQRTGGDAHSIDLTVAELLPAGEFNSDGEIDPFAR